MKHIFLRSLKLFSPLILIHFGACTLESDGEELEWVGNKESFDEEFTLMQTLDSEAVLIKRVNKEPLRRGETIDIPVGDLDNNQTILFVRDRLTLLQLWQFE